MSRLEMATIASERAGIETIVVDGRGIAVAAAGGAGADVLLLHGFGSDRMSWLANQTEIAAAAVVTALDLPGHGASSVDVGDGSVAFHADVVAAVIEARRMRDVRVVGHSWGGAVAIALAQRRPDLVNALVLIAPAGLGRAIDPDFLAAFPAMADPVMAEELLHRLVSRPRLINRQMVARVLEHLGKPGARDAMRRIADQLGRIGEDLAAAMAAVVAADLPRMVVWGDADAINPPDAERLAGFGGIQHFVAGAGHLPHIESSRAVNGWIVEFLGRRASRRAAP